MKQVVKQCLDNTNCLCQLFTRDIPFQSKLQFSLLIETGIKVIVSVNTQSQSAIRSRVIYRCFSGLVVSYLACDYKVKGER